MQRILFIISLILSLGVSLAASPLKFHITSSNQLRYSAQGNGLYIMADFSRPYLQVSSNSTEWTPVDLSDFFGTEFGERIIGLWFTSGRFFMQTTKSGTIERDVYQSVDGENWFHFADLESAEIRDMDSNGVTMVWVTSGGIYRGAADLTGGMTFWDPFVASSIDFGDGIFLCAGSNQTRYFTGTAASPSVGAAATGIVKYHIDNFLVIGGQTKILSSAGVQVGTVSGGFGSAFTHVYGNGGNLFATFGQSIFELSGPEGSKTWALNGDLISSAGSDPKSYLKGRGITNRFTDTSTSGIYSFGPGYVALFWSGGVARSGNGLDTWSGELSAPGARCAGGDTPGFVMSVNANHANYWTDEDGWKPSLVTPEIELLMDVAYGNGIFLAVSKSGVAYHMTASTLADRENPWTKIENVPHFREITFGNGTFLAQTDLSDPGGGFGRLFRSADGVSWTPIVLDGSLSGLTDIGEVIFTGGQFIATSSRHTIAYWTSNDGITWIPQQLPSEFFSMAFGRNDFFRGARSIAGNTVFARDGSVTTLRANGMSQFSEIPRTDFIEQIGNFLILNAGSQAWYSDDGLQWNVANSVPWFESIGQISPGSSVTLDGKTLVTNFRGSSLAETQTMPEISGIRRTSSASIRVKENEPAGTQVAVFAPESVGDYGGTANFSLVSGGGDDDNELFTLENGILRLAEPLDYEAASSRSVRVEMTIPELSVRLEQQFVIEVLNLPLLSFENITIVEGESPRVNLVLSETPYDGWTNGSFRMHTEEGTALYGIDFESSPLFDDMSLTQNREIGLGTTRDDLLPEAPEFYEIIFFEPVDIEFTQDRLRVTIDDNDLGRGLDEVPAWTSLGGDFFSMAFGPTSGIAGDSEGRIIFTGNGQTWEEVFHQPGLAFTQMTYGNGVFLATANAIGMQPQALEAEDPNASPLVGRQGTMLLRSTDGRNWVPVDFSPPRTLRELIFADGQFVGLDFREIMTSFDGLTWNRVSLEGVSADVRESFQDITHGAGLFAVAGSRGNILTSFDALSWSVAYSSMDVVNWRHITYGDQGFVAVASDFSTISSDGVNWNQQPQTLIPDFFPDLAFHDGSYVIATFGGTGTVDLLESNDGINWIAVDLETSTSQSLRGLASGLGKFWVFGDQQSIFTRDQGAAEWIARRNQPEMAPTAIFSDGTVTAIGGARSVRIQGADGVWQTSLEGLDADPNGLWHHNGTWVMTAGFERLWRSTDGENWTQFPIAPGDPADNLTFRSVTYSGGAWFVAASTGKILKSTDDGVSWTVQQILNNMPFQQLLKIKEVNGVLFALGGASIATSSDGVSWNEFNIGGTVFYDVTFASGLYVVSASPGRLYHSTDLTNWTAFTVPGSTRPITAISYGNGFFMINIGRRLAFSRNVQGPWTFLGELVTDNLIFDGTEFITSSGSPNVLHRSSGTSTGFVFSFGDATEVAQLSPEDAEPDATPFNDSVPNLLKYAFNMNIAGPDSSSLQDGGSGGLPQEQLVEVNGQMFFRVEFIRRTQSELIYTPMMSSTLQSGSFTEMTAPPTIQPIDGEFERVIIDEPIDTANNDSCFSRIGVSIP